MNKHSKAFTLIELLVVIAIIAILAAILFPVFAQAKMAAKKTQALSGVKQLGLAVQMYQGDTDNRFPFAFEGSKDWAGDGHFWSKGVLPYVKTLGIFYSPTDTAAGKPSADPGLRDWAGVALSFASNAYYGSKWTGYFPLHGPMGAAGWPGWLGDGTG